MPKYKVVFSEQRLTTHIYSNNIDNAVKQAKGFAFIYNSALNKKDRNKGYWRDIISIEYEKEII